MAKYLSNRSRDEPWKVISVTPDDIQTYLATVLTRDNISTYASLAVPDLNNRSDPAISKSLAFYFVFETMFLRDSGRSVEEIKEEMIKRYKLNPGQQEKIFPKKN